MKKCMFLSSALMFLLFCSLHAQTVTNTTWRGYFPAPINDSITIHWQKDSSFVTDSKGKVLIKSTYTREKNAITFIDFGGMYACGVKGTYVISIKENILVFTLLSDACIPRNTFAKMKWRKIK